MENLKEAYEGTKYTVFDLPIVIEIDKKCSALDELLKEHKVNEWAYITAWNPYSKTLPDEVNSQRHQQLIELVKDFPIWEGEGIGTDPAWKPERSLLILGISKNQAIKIGRKLEQNAIVCGLIGELVELLPLFDFEK